MPSLIYAESHGGPGLSGRAPYWYIDIAVQPDPYIDVVSMAWSF